MTTVDASLGPLAPVEPKVQSDVIPMSFVACVSDEAVLKANLLASPIFRGRGRGSAPRDTARGDLDP